MEMLEDIQLAYTCNIFSVHQQHCRKTFNNRILLRRLTFTAGAITSVSRDTFTLKWSNWVCAFCGLVTIVLTDNTLINVCTRTEKEIQQTGPVETLLLSLQSAEVCVCVGVGGGGIGTSVCVCASSSLNLPIELCSYSKFTFYQCFGKSKPCTSGLLYELLGKLFSLALYR